MNFIKAKQHKRHILRSQEKKKNRKKTEERKMQNTQKAEKKALSMGNEMTTIESNLPITPWQEHWPSHLQISSHARRRH